MDLLIVTVSLLGMVILLGLAKEEKKRKINEEWSRYESTIVSSKLRLTNWPMFLHIDQTRFNKQ